MSLFFDRVAIIGIGLLGGSVGLALKARGACGTVVGVGRSRSSIEAGLEVGAIDEAAADLPQAAEGADLVVVCTPVGSVAGIIAEMESSLDENCVVTDVGSTKQSIVVAVEQLRRAASKFVGSHPLAGSEKKGVRHASATLFESATVFLTPTPSAEQGAKDITRRMWEHLGGRTVEVEPAVHDHIVAQTSHLPHVVAAMLVAGLRTLPEEYAGLTGKGFLDTTRIASSDPEMWADICLDNAAEIRHAMARLRNDLDEFDLYLDEGEYEKVLQFFGSMKALRDSLNHEKSDG